MLVRMLEAGAPVELAVEVQARYHHDDLTRTTSSRTCRGADPIFDAWLGALAAHDLGVRRNVIQGIPSTDHLSFLRAGLPGFTAIKDYSTYDTRTHHTYADLAERVQDEDLVQSAIVLAVFAWHAAMRDDRIPRPPLP
jgi:carboxypeptidase Q